MGRLFGQMTGRSLRLSITLFLAFVMSYLFLGVLAFQFPETLRVLLRWAADAERFLTTTGLPARYNNFIEIYLSKATILLVFLTIFSRIVIAVVATIVNESFRSLGPAKPKTAQPRRPAPAR
ncbi:hypothetical protein F1654_10250 [Alkalicaulis satelles]|uniref:Uncharacterized protein n=1 Tax=Alkalicaulis satelles TaxID=2609175 RepID=A0A5M6ZBW6_9PROT|nr:hypothetical protein [Alkalicaulis satelles]KAA5802212.1 hypothetical protein F1654_10250 [Alkalicaulis satelles]